MASRKRRGKAATAAASEAAESQDEDPQQQVADEGRDAVASGEGVQDLPQPFSAEDVTGVAQQTRGKRAKYCIGIAPTAASAAAAAAAATAAEASHSDEAEEK
mmetsp:Transcript_20691/g.40447  ORF Transcript_20691/g.40447 Transcript_20691/m.40447 type:complete len:103 (+) Transcript_20691:15-323(+)